MIFPTNPNRKILNILKGKSNPIYFLKPFLLLFALSFFLIYSFYYKFISLSEEIAAKTNDRNILILLNSFLAEISIYAAAGVFCLGLLTIFLWLLYAHRTFGPLTPIHRFIQDLKAGDYQKRVALRKNDEHQSLAMELNALAEKLEEKQNEKQ